MIQLTDITHGYGPARSRTQVLDRVSLVMPTSQMWALTGASGSGKSTLLNLVGLLDRPHSGEIKLAGQNVSGLSAHEAAKVRNRLIGFVFQSFHLMPRLSAWENVALPLVHRAVGRTARRHAAMEQLERVGLDDRLYHRPEEMSGGQRQRVAIARALVTQPRLILADEPTGNLDSESGAMIMALLSRINREMGVSILMVTHDEALARSCDGQVVMQDGRIIQTVTG
ncbi:ABC transporter ATP-binding protein [Brevundimonas terrae]|uniref:ABC transporter ATP-binding protein n=1 Tax=Brevundimonas terrae TaxID=363631 RepID=A0ABN0YA26_9CAUL|nr:ABC transporter ATP-binding protein [Brevundimonas terrae]NIJ27968.1 putative ABC transport system ATP-binding protein [Brevundimonas terrae]